MSKTQTKRYFDDIEVAIKEAKKRAKTQYSAMYLYQAIGGIFISTKRGAGYIAKVYVNGNIDRLDQDQETTMKYFIVDNYTHMVEAACDTKQTAQTELKAINSETGLFIYSIIEAKGKADLERKIAEQFSEQGADE